MNYDHNRDIHFNHNDISNLLIGRQQAALLHRRTNHKLFLTAHRGNGPTSVFGERIPEDIYPENSLPAIKHAILAGADAVEIDIFKCAPDHHDNSDLIVTHDDEIHRNAYGISRLTSAPWSPNYHIQKKTRNEIQEIEIGRNHEVMPTLKEVLMLVNNANTILKNYNLSPVVLNIELKDTTATTALLNNLEKYLCNNRSLENFIFCSFHHNALADLISQASSRGMTKINVQPGIKTTALFGKDNVDPKTFMLKDPRKGYIQDVAKSLCTMAEDMQFQGLDCILWDARADLITQIKRANYRAPSVKTDMELHLSTSDFRQYNEPFAGILLSASQHLKVYFKCDDVHHARKILLLTHQMSIGIGKQMLCYKSKNKYRHVLSSGYHGSYDHSQDLKYGYSKPIAYSQYYHSHYFSSMRHSSNKALLPV
ncbi:glycerophosphodiester phosphodiesterase [Enterobacteriaceae bacterium LUAb1]